MRVLSLFFSYIVLIRSAIFTRVECAQEKYKWKARRNPNLALRPNVQSFHSAHFHAHAKVKGDGFPFAFSSLCCAQAHVRHTRNLLPCSDTQPRVRGAID